MSNAKSTTPGNMSADALLAFETYDAIVDGFDWQIPDRTNIAAQVFDRWSEDRGRVALFVEHQDGSRTAWSYWELIRLAKR
jgi:acetyl-CoA synthetase